MFEGKGPAKNPKRNSRIRYNRARVRLALTLQHLEHCTEDLLGQRGNLYGKAKIERLLADVRALRDAHGLTVEVPEFTSDEDAALSPALGLEPMTS